ncbi:hypothetical protein Agabi119p4_10661 [Agaricus bisporus var. burnettii]|uniref:NACHT domain-containing protein n=1 Tax=Agaricus bisporus var. burnettii TaxID=192524 RepID=A0A8H7C2G1_AGABI|nr:hypothetical protein Agabi119p4_10661 [Agaricus bisporus var. burnettii]
MPPRRKKNKISEWVLGFFSSKDEIHYMPDGPQRHAGPGGFFNNAQQLTVNNSTMTAVQGNQYHYTTTYVHGDGNLTTHIMKLLSDHIILGAAHDDSARVPPPRCHPGTRELLLWITGPAGVGKSAIVQTFAEYLVESKLLGASVFCSRPNKRNNPHRIFVTIAYQLAIRITAYREFLVERLSLDPQLLNRDMTTQFNTFIVEPFVEKKIGAGGKRWGILLDGLDELEGEDSQCEIIQLISTFTLEHSDAPLVWIISSRPESHISNTFDDNQVRRSCWSEYIPIDSTEACEDVDRFLRSSFKMIRKKYRHCVPSDWPSNTDFLSVTAAASGLFVYAEVVMQFIRDPDYADPVSRLKVLLSIIDRSHAVPIKEKPFVHLDALYQEIISSIPPALWPMAKQILAFTIHWDQIEITRFPLTWWPNVGTLRGMSILLGMTPNRIYASFNKCRSTLKLPDWKVAHKARLMFLHASFADYLRDSSRSGNFYVGSVADVEADVMLSLLEIWNKCSGDDIATTSVESTWHQYCSKLDGKSPPRAIAKFHSKLFHDSIYCLGPLAYRVLEHPTESRTYSQLRQVHMRKLCYFFKADDLLDFVHQVMNVSTDSCDVELLRQTELGDLTFQHFDWKDMSPAYAYYGKKGEFSKSQIWTLRRPRTRADLKSFVSELESLQERSPKLKVIIFGSVPQGRVAVFLRPLEGESLDSYDSMPYVIPYLK